jgi:hypothetical protein
VQAAPQVLSQGGMEAAAGRCCMVQTCNGCNKQGGGTTLLREQKQQHQQLWQFAAICMMVVLLV